MLYLYSSCEYTHILCLSLCYNKSPKLIIILLLTLICRCLFSSCMLTRCGGCLLHRLLLCIAWDIGINTG